MSAARFQRNSTFQRNTEGPGPLVAARKQDVPPLAGAGNSLSWLRGRAKPGLVEAAHATGLRPPLHTMHGGTAFLSLAGNEGAV